MKQTAVELLIEKISLKEKTNETFLFPTIKNEILEQAKELEEEQGIEFTKWFCNYNGLTFNEKAISEEHLKILFKQFKNE